MILALTMTSVRMLVLTMLNDVDYIEDADDSYNVDSADNAG